MSSVADFYCSPNKPTYYPLQPSQSYESYSTYKTDLRPVSSSTSLVTSQSRSSSLESVCWKEVFILVGVILISGVVGYLVPTYALQTFNLYISRSIIAGTATFLGLVCGYALYPIARRQFDIAIWSILIEASTEARSSRPLKLSNLDSWIENVALLSALQVLWSRCLGRVKGVRSFCVVTFALTLLLAASTPFLYGRTIDLPLEFHLDESSYGDISIIGSIKPEELDHIQKWGLGLTKSSLVQRVRPETIRGVHPLNNQTVFLPEITTSTVYDGGFSTYPGNRAKKLESKTTEYKSSTQPPSNLYWPRWGHRNKCKAFNTSLFESNLALAENKTAYLFVPKDFLQDMFDFLEVEMPTLYNTTNNPYTPVDDQSPFSHKSVSLDPSSIGLSYKFEYTKNPIQAIAALPVPGEVGSEDQLISVQAVLIRQLAPNGGWPAAWIDESDIVDNSALYVGGAVGKLGYDAAICVGVTEPYIVGTFKSISGLQTFEISSTGANLKPWGTKNGTSHQNDVVNINVPDFYDLQWGTFVTASAEEIRVGSDVDTYPWTATIILQSLGFSEQFISSDSHFEMDRVENLLGTLLSQNALPYFVGSQLVEAVEYSYKEVAKAKASIMYQAILFGFLLLVGLCGAFLRPTLPLGVQSRPTTLSAFHPVLRQLTDSKGDVTLAVAASIEVPDRRDSFVNPY